MHGWADRDGQPEVGIRLVRQPAGLDIANQPAGGILQPAGEPRK
jgi:hypothetical protein